MRKCTTLALGASALVGISYANDLSEEVFAAIDKQNKGLRTVNKEVSNSRML
jgi:hypothetical protein